MDRTFNAICFERSTVEWLFCKVLKPFQDKQGFQNITDFMSKLLKSIYIGINEQNFELKKKINKQNCLILFSGTPRTLNNFYFTQKVSVLNYVKRILITKLLAKWNSSVWEHTQTTLLAANWFLSNFFCSLTIIISNLRKFASDLCIKTWHFFYNLAKYVLSFRELSLLVRLGLFFHNLAAIKANRILSWVSLLILGQTSISDFIKKFEIGFKGTSVNWKLEKGNAEWKFWSIIKIGIVLLNELEIFT